MASSAGVLPCNRMKGRHAHAPNRKHSYETQLLADRHASWLYVRAFHGRERKRHQKPGVVRCCMLTVSPTLGNPGFGRALVFVDNRYSQTHTRGSDDRRCGKCPMKRRHASYPDNPSMTFGHYGYLRSLRVSLKCLGQGHPPAIYRR